MKLEEIFAGVEVGRVGEEQRAVEVRGVSTDSRTVKPGDLFVAVEGSRANGAHFVEGAISNGAIAVVAEEPMRVGVPCYPVASARVALARIAANLWGRPAESLALLGVTGTNGKTTTAFLLEAIAAASGASAGCLGTIRHAFAGRELEASHTTPDALQLHRLFRDMVDAGTEVVAMEVSSHALVQERVHGLVFKAAAFTNLSRDHLDYHRDMEEYFQAKRRLFVENLARGGVAVVNGDDTFGVRIYSELRKEGRVAWRFSREGAGEVSATEVECTLGGIRARLKTPAGDIPIQSKLVGAHNLENILAAAGVALGAGMSRRDVQEGVSRVTRVPGRLERVEEEGICALVDYAHTDDALRRALLSVRSLTRGRLIVVFGCGGDRDAGKRPLMGQAAAEGADLVVVTSDNPRSEEPSEILRQIVPGIEKAGVRRISPAKARAGERGYLVEEGREEAIRLAIGLARRDDSILIAGKGHEKFQIASGQKTPFDDLEVARHALRSRS